MPRLCAISTIVAVAVLSSTAKAEGTLLLRGTVIDGRTLGDDGEIVPLLIELESTQYLIERSDIDHYNLVEKRLEGTLQQLRDCEKGARSSPCLEPICGEPSLLESLGWATVIPAIVVAAASGVVAGILIAADNNIRL